MALGIFLLIFGIGIIVLGLYIRKHPTFAWERNEAWKVQGDSEPSGAYIDYMTFIGAVCIWVGAFFAVMGMLQFL
ncbi:hypothetical protein D3C81_2019810 [compost metagenome]